MQHMELDNSLERTEIDGFAFPLGAIPVEHAEPRPGCVVEFEAADGALGEGDWEEWPDRYVFDIVISAARLRAFCRALWAILPDRLYPILDILGNDAYREVDPYIAYDLVGLDIFYNELRRSGDWLYEDGLVGFGAMSLDPFLYIFVDEHKIITIRVEASHRDRIDRVLTAFDIPIVEELKGVDAFVHEHRTVLFAPPERTDLLSPEEVVEDIADAWRLRLNIDRTTNLDDKGAELGVTGWRCILREEPQGGAARYAELLLRADSLDEAERLVLEASNKHRPNTPDNNGKAPQETTTKKPDPATPPPSQEVMVSLVSAYRITNEEYSEMLSESGHNKIDPPAATSDSKVDLIRWHTEHDEGGEKPK